MPYVPAPLFASPLFAAPLFVGPNVAVVNNITTQVGLNLAIGSVVGSQTIAQVSNNQVGINQGRGWL